MAENKIEILSWKKDNILSGDWSIHAIQNETFSTH